ncbi:MULTISPECIES: tRNA/rRNA methyltransferase [Edwardsiella]|uniref:tRNA (cytidine/uridine-2'-O-)-methyltransferase TrmJ n=2 Tax=Edwardsiella anguillarum TaxID=1821960 RepID=A0A076LLI4_9GAMM|nr:MULTISPECIES: tRNA/rRNA methyltransferase [Edwardsiella]AKM45935.1 RNA methyltransferase [Edwardsiella sp. EA181011]GAJ66934.1 rRNA methyltransferase [Edwardsiella piscicida]AIJ08766.1 RNA methyltransferase, TrmH family, group 1 [Edwardsiella anguillarum ET080813]AKR76788.1 tRNA/rRNA methyltransferase [Edwardsiella sp. LADL05-105]KAB0592455.1 tRNA/rRNA methyltransferase [Edwardsiella anguillarum]
MQIHIVLVAPARAENVGAAARAMKTMGFTSLRIVDSQVDGEPAARWVAHGAGDILDGARHFDTLAQALEDVDFSVASTARSRARFHYYCTPQELCTILQEKQRWMASCALVFGREDSGLTNDELALVDLLTGVPMAADYPSLNLGQAVMVFCYQLSSLMQVQAAQAPAAQEEQLAALRARTDRLLTTLGVDGDTKLSDWLDQRIGLLAQRDTAMLHRLLHDIESALERSVPGKKM